MVSARGQNLKLCCPQHQRAAMKAGNKLTAVADDALGHAQRRVGRHLDGPQMSSLEPHRPQNSRSIQRRVIPQNPSK